MPLFTVINIKQKKEKKIYVSVVLVNCFPFVRIGPKIIF